MCAVGNPAGFAGAYHRVNQLEYKPEAKHPVGRDPGRIDQDADGYDYQDARTRVKQQIGAQHPGDGAARAYHRDFRFRIEYRLRQGGHQTA